MKPRILFVDDEFNLLAGLKRQLHNHMEVELARSGEEALDRLRSRTSYSAIVSDLKMPGVDGVRLLCQARTIAPDIVRIILTGHIDPRSAISAVNDAGVFRILMKPCEPPILVKALGEAVEYRKLVVQQREGAEQTSAGMTALLTDLLGLLSPFALDKGERLAGHARRIIHALHLGEPWLLETAARLSQLGCITLGPQLVEKAAAGAELSSTEAARFEGHTDVGARLLAHVPKLIPVSLMLAGQRDMGARGGALVDDIVSVGVRLLRVVNAFDTLLSTGLPTRDVIARLEMDPGSFPPQMVAALEPIGETIEGVAWVIKATDLKPGMIFEQDLLSKDGVLLASRGQAANASLIARVLKIREAAGVPEPVHVRVPAEFNQIFAPHR
jgi:CheY-like chemotaxis protein